MTMSPVVMITGSPVAAVTVLVVAECTAGHDGDTRLIQQVVRERLRVDDRSPSEELLHLGENIERPVRIRAAEAVDPVDRRDEPCATAGVLVMHPLHLVVMAGE